MADSHQYKYKKLELSEHDNVILIFAWMGQASFPFVLTLWITVISRVNTAYTIFSIKLLYIS